MNGMIENRGVEGSRAATFSVDNFFDRIVESNRDRILRLVEIGVLRDNCNNYVSTRDFHVGSSDYSSRGCLLEPWSIWQDWNHLTSWDHDILKRLYRTKVIDGMSKAEARMQDYRKIIHICNERLRQLEAEQLRDALIQSVEGTQQRAPHE